MSNPPNPFSDVPSNPYQSPTYEAFAGPTVPFTREQARLRLLGPAIGLGLAGFLWLAYGGFALVVASDDLGNIKVNDEAERIGFVIGIAFTLVWFLVPSILNLVGAVQMLRVRGYPWCWVGVITGIIPCTLCFPISFPFAVWGIIVLLDSRIQGAFRSSAYPFLGP